LKEGKGMDYKIIAVDFDGTLYKDKGSEAGEPNMELITYLKHRQDKGDKLILWTCRCNEKLQQAVAWALQQGLIFDAVNDDLPEVVERWGKDNRKIYANEYVDNSNSSWYTPDAVISERMSQAERSELWGRLIDVVEDWLTEKGISVGKHEDAAIVCGSDYDYLVDRFADAVGISRDCADVI